MFFTVSVDGLATVTVASCLLHNSSIDRLAVETRPRTRPIVFHMFSTLDALSI